MAPMPKAASVVAYARIDHSDGDGFVLPLLRAKHQGPWLVQQADESTNQVIALKSVDGDLESIVPIPNSVDVRVGEPQVYAFLEGDKMHLGSKTIIEPSLRIFIRNNPTDLATTVQVFQIVGTVDERRQVRLQMKNLIERQTGAAAANSFVASALAEAFWTKLFAAWSLAADPGRRELLRSHFRVSFNSENRVHVKNVDPIDDQERESLKHIISELDAEFGAFEVQLEPLTSPDGLIEHRPTILRSSPRQEERIALSLVWLLQDHEGLKSFLNTYRPQAAFEQQSMRLVSSLLEGDEWLSASLPTRQVIVSLTIISLYRLCYPMNRGHFLALMSKHLGKFPTINQTLRQISQDTTSFFVREHEATIRQNLGIE